jgi:DNA mismatch endonuclease (patch repair protein)
MADRITSEVRSRNMAAIKGKDTKPELTVRHALHARGFRFRLHRRDLPGNPDMVFAKHKAVIWVNGCFWHGHDCGAARVPLSRIEYWGPKIERTKARDAAAVEAIDAMGWRSLTIWECALRGKGAMGLESVVEMASRWLAEGRKTSEIPG